MYYLIFVSAVFGYDVYRGKIDLKFESILIFAIIMMWLLMIFRKYFNKYQGIDPTKKDNDYYIES